MHVVTVTYKNGRKEHKQFFSKYNAESFATRTGFTKDEQDSSTPDHRRIVAIGTETVPDKLAA